MISSSDRVMNYELATLVIGLRELARATALFDDDARRIIADELLVAAVRFTPASIRASVHAQRAA